MRIKLTILLVLLPLLSIAQDIERVVIEGFITAPVSEDVEGVNIYNNSTQKGTVTNDKGEFKLKVGVNDRVLVTALQFQSFTIIVDKGIVDTKIMKIYLNPAVNQLEEVIVRPYDLSGNIVADVNRVKTYTFAPKMDLSYEALNYKYEFQPDALTKVEGNAAEEALHDNALKNGANILGIIGLLFPENMEINLVKNKNIEDRVQISRTLRQRFSNAYIEETFGIPKEKANDFLYFAEDGGLTETMLKGENEMELLDYMYQQSNLYKKNSEEE
ncbi:carboxypeptidase-like regulatory domain-containing protein [Marixanthomonas ophiurae]|uniref:Carboxypeptidase-like regulatory domain-containing protein n=1 Tax=Marixanthomonas ophiurae TaxID=387659 RepID=A0A3E1QCL6_9FLAO|nr:carboxypeptidase-like regulatory domain-containing protein [Marixanthomonas ophiurae]RFN59852.1 hypothetical protein DZ858_07335 [Marixanthomonas ophiurae]